MSEITASSAPRRSPLAWAKLRLFGPWLRREIDMARQQGQTDRVVRIFRRLAQWGDVNAQFTLAQCYVSGRGVVHNLPEAMAWMRRAAEQGHVDAMYGIGYFYQNAPGLGNPALSPRRYYDAEGSGNDNERGNGRLLFPAGLDVVADHEKAFFWMQRAAEKGQPQAICQLAVQYANGQGVEKDSAKAVELLRSACDKGLPQAHFLLAHFLMNALHGLERDLEAAMTHLETAARHGHLDAAYQLGSMLIMPGMPRYDVKQAEYWLNNAGQRRHVQAMTTLARLYFEGKIVPQDDVRAVAWFRKAAAHGDAQAQWRLGTLFQRGRGVEQDGYEAAHWYEMAGRQGVVAAQYALAMLYRQGDGVLRNNKLAAEWFQRAVDGGDIRAMINLGLLQASGALGERDKVEADRLFRLAEAATHDPAVLEQIRHYRDMHRIGQTPPAAAAPAVEAGVGG